MGSRVRDHRSRYHKLDKSEGYLPGRETNSHFRREYVVLHNGDNQQLLTIFVYFGDPIPNPPLPNIDYKNLIVSGAQYWNLPEAYVRELQAIKVSR